MFKVNNNRFLVFLLVTALVCWVHIEYRNIWSKAYSEPRQTSKLKLFAKIVCKYYPAGIDLFNVINRNTRTMCEVCPKKAKKDARNNSIDSFLFFVFLTFFEGIEIEVVTLPLLLTLNRFHKFFWCFHC